MKRGRPQTQVPYPNPIARRPAQWDDLLTKIFGCRPLSKVEELHEAVHCIEAMQAAAAGWSRDHTGPRGRLKKGVPFDLEYTYELENHALELLGYVYAERERILLETRYAEPGPAIRVVKDPAAVALRITGIIGGILRDANKPPQEKRRCGGGPCNDRKVPGMPDRDKSGRFLKGSVFAMPKRDARGRFLKSK